MRVALHGYGKMGRAVERVAVERGHEVVTIIDRSRRPDLGEAEILIDFSQPPAVDAAVEIACKGHVGLVIGTTGWNDRMDRIRQRIESAGIGAVFASNFSPGANVMFALAQRAAELFSRFDQYSTGMEERHHSLKRDAPSGTALQIAARVVEGSNGKLTPPIVSSRVGSEFGLHTLFFDSEDDLIEISHRARSREGFARGAVFAAELLRGRKGLIPFDELVMS
jgi:4-hydroxy-tetrahydrodipicolinate reductase